MRQHTRADQGDETHQGAQLKLITEDETGEAGGEHTAQLKIKQLLHTREDKTQRDTHGDTETQSQEI